MNAHVQPNVSLATVNFGGPGYSGAGLAPQLIGVGESDWMLSFAYNFTGDAPSPVNVLGENLLGGVLTVATANVQGISTIPPFRSLLFSATFDGATDATDGELTIWNQSASQVFKIGSPNVPPYGTTIPTQMVTGCLPIIPVPNPTLIFVKSANLADANGVDGSIFCTLFTGKIPPYLYSGNGYSL